MNSVAVNSYTNTMTTICLDVRRLARDVGAVFSTDKAAAAFEQTLMDAFQSHQNTGWPYTTNNQLHQLAITLILQYVQLNQLQIREGREINLANLRDVHEYIDLVG